jgi:hypothetical protein
VARAPLLSRQTLAILGRVFDSIIDRTVRFGPQKFPYNLRYSTTIVDSLMYEMGFEQTFIEACRQQYFWDFSAIIRELESGKFRPNPNYRSSKILAQNHGLNAQPYLLKLAALCSRMCSNGAFLEQSADLAATLERDGWLHEDGVLRRIDQGVIDKPAERTRIERLIDATGLDHDGVIESHLREALRLTKNGNFHPCLSEWRSFLQSIIQGVWRATKSARDEFRSFADSPGWKDGISFLVRSGFLTEDEKPAYDSAFGFLSSGSHPGISEEEDAHLAEILCLILGQALLLKFQRWAANDHRGF